MLGLDLSFILVLFILNITIFGLRHVHLYNNKKWYSLLNLLISYAIALILVLIFNFADINSIILNIFLIIVIPIVSYFLLREAFAKIYYEKINFVFLILQGVGLIVYLIMSYIQIKPIDFSDQENIADIVSETVSSHVSITPGRSSSDVIIPDITTTSGRKLSPPRSLSRDTMISALFSPGVINEKNTLSGAIDDPSTLGIPAGITGDIPYSESESESDTDSQFTGF